MDACEDVTGEHLAGITTFYPYTLYYKGITTLPPGVFAGLSSVRTLNVSYNSLGTLPSGLFSDLSSVVTINLSGNRLTAVPSGAFSGLSSLLNLNLRNNQITTLPSGAFSGMSSLSTLNLNDNRLTTVPSGAFSGLSSLTQLQLQGNPLTSLPPRVFSGLPSLDWLVLSQAAPGYIEDMRGALIDMPPSLTYFYISAKLTVSLERVGDTRIKAVMPSGAPFDVQVPVTVVNGSLEDHRTTLTIPRGVVESAPVNVHREGGATGAVTANIGTLPGLPSGHASYALVKDKRLPLVIYSHPVVAGDLPMAVARVTTLNRDAMDRVIICNPPPRRSPRTASYAGPGPPPRQKSTRCSQMPAHTHRSPIAQSG